MTVLIFFAGLALGALVLAVLLAPRLAAARTALAEARQNHEARLQDLAAGQRQIWDEVQKSLAAQLPALADQVLGQRTEQLKAAAHGEFQLAQAPLQAAVKEMRVQLGAYQERVAALDRQIATVAQAGQAITAEARSLKQALRGGGDVRGSWGEQRLANILEQCGLREQSDYFRQFAVEGGGRIDFVIEIPPSARLAVDCKTPDFLPWSEEEDEAARRQRAASFAQSLGGMGVELARRGYAEKLERSVPCVVMFVPSEAAFRAALDAQPELFKDLVARRVVLASPTTIFPIVSLLSSAWSEHRAQRQAKQLLEECRELGDRLSKFLDHLARLGKALDQAGVAFNAAVGSYQARLGPQVRVVQKLDPEFAIDAPELREVQSRPTMALTAGAGEPAERE